MVGLYLITVAISICTGFFCVDFGVNVHFCKPINVSLPTMNIDLYLHHECQKDLFKRMLGG